MATKPNSMIPSRRAVLLGGVSLSVLAGIRAAVATPGDQHSAWLERRETIDREDCRVLGELEDQHGPSLTFPPGVAARWGKYRAASNAERDRLTDLLIDTPALTPEGMAAKAYLLWAECGIGTTDRGEEIALGLMADLQRMATRPLSDFEADCYAKARAIYTDLPPAKAYERRIDNIVNAVNRAAEYGSAHGINS